MPNKHQVLIRLVDLLDGDPRFDFEDLIPLSEIVHAVNISFKSSYREPLGSVGVVNLKKKTPFPKMERG